MPPVKSADMETPVTEPMVISTIEGGIVSVCAPVAASSATSSPGLAPRAFISGNNAAPPPPYPQPWRRKCRRPDTSPRSARRRDRRAHDQANWRGENKCRLCLNVCLSFSCYVSSGVRPLYQAALHDNEISRQYQYDYTHEGGHLTRGDPEADRFDQYAKAATKRQKR